MAGKRLVWADSLKGLLILLVVLGHALQTTLGKSCDTNHLWNLIYSFHMPAFMAVSGYLAYRKMEMVGGSRLLSSIHRRFRQLIVPFSLWTFVLLLNGDNLTWSSVGTYLLYPDKGLWFLWVLFFITVFYSSGCWLANRMKIKDEWMILGLCLVLAAVMVLFEVRVLGFQFIAYYFLFYSLGYYLHKYSDRVITQNMWVIVCLAVVWAAMGWFWNMHKLPTFLKGLPLPATLTQYVYRFLTAAIAIYVLLAVSPKLLNVNGLWNVPLVSMGGCRLVFMWYTTFSSERLLPCSKGLMWVIHL